MLSGTLRTAAMKAHPAWICAAVPHILEESFSPAFCPSTEGAVSSKRVSQAIVVVVVLAFAFASTGSALAWTGDCSSSVTVQSGDTFNTIAAACGTTVNAISAANSGVGSNPQAGQVLYMPAGSASPQGNYPQQMGAMPAQGDYPQQQMGPMSAQGYYPQQMGGTTYIVQPGDTLGEIAMSMGTSLNAIMAVNPQIGNPSWIYPGQVINLPGGYAPASSDYYYPPSGYYGPTYYPPYYPAPSYAPYGNPPPGSVAPRVCPPDCYTGNPSIIYPRYSPALGWRGLKVTYKYGLTVRTAPARFHGEIAGLYVEAIKGSTWTYLKGTTTVDAEGFVWVQVVLPRVVGGYETGWLVVKDALGNYYTDPNINP
jgi:LysM repeat protein